MRGAVWINSKCFKWYKRNINHNPGAAHHLECERK